MKGIAFAAVAVVLILLALAATGHLKTSEETATEQAEAPATAEPAPATAEQTATDEAPDAADTSEEAAPAADEAPDETAETVNSEEAASLLLPKPGELIAGDDNAPVLIVEYASLSCPHCAHFYTDVYPQLKKDYIDTGKARFVFRDFPLNAPALAAAHLARCIEDHDKQEKFISVLFQQQAAWAFDEDYQDKLKEIALMGDFSQEEYDSCMQNGEVEKDILENTKQANELLDINSTPTFFINGKKMEGPAAPVTFKQAIGEALEEK